METLPTDLLRDIHFYLRKSSIVALRSTCKRFHSLFSFDEFKALNYLSEAVKQSNIYFLQKQWRAPCYNTFLSCCYHGKLELVKLFAPDVKERPYRSCLLQAVASKDLDTYRFIVNSFTFEEFNFEQAFYLAIELEQLEMAKDLYFRNSNKRKLMFSNA